MTVINKSAKVIHSQQQMYDLVNDVDCYPKFIPYCTASEVVGVEEDEIQAKLTFSGSGMHKSFTTCNRLQPHKMIEIRLLDGPFKHLEGFWRFDALDDTFCKVSLDLEFEFASHWLSIAFGPFFHQIANRLVDVFCERAKEVYGND